MELTTGRDFDVYAAGMDVGLARKLTDLRPSWSGMPHERPHVVDLGCGTGQVLAHVLDELTAAGAEPSGTAVDCSATLAATATARLQGRATVAIADLANLPLDDASVDVVLLSSVLHEVFSYGGYRHAAVERVLVEARRVLRPGGRLAVRDGVAPARPGQWVWLHLLDPDDRQALARFERDFRPQHESPGIRLQQAPGYEPYELSRMTARDAFEFCSKKDYRSNWDQEVQEQFGVYTQDGWVDVVRRAGFERVTAHSYVHPWVHRNRIAGKVLWRSDHGGAPATRTAFPATTAVVHAHA